MAKKLGRNSAVNAVKLVSELSDKVAIPQLVDLRSTEELTIWDQLTSARARDDWRDFDLLLMAKAVRLEADIRKHQRTLDEQGVTMTNDRGTLVVNPMLTVVDSLQRQQLSVMRSLNLSQTRQDPRTMNGQGAEKARLSHALDGFDDLIVR